MTPLDCTPHYGAGQRGFGNARVVRCQIFSLVVL